MPLNTAIDTTAYVTYSLREWLTPAQIVSARKRAAAYLNLGANECVLRKNIDVPEWAAFAKPHNRFACYISLLHTATGDIYSVEIRLDSLRRNVAPQVLSGHKMRKS